MYSILFILNNTCKKKQEIANLKNPIVMSKVDLAREERILKYDKLLDLLKEIYYTNRIQKILKDTKQTVDILSYLLF